MLTSYITEYIYQKYEINIGAIKLTAGFIQIPAIFPLMSYFLFQDSIQERSIYLSIYLTIHVSIYHLNVSLVSFNLW